MAYRCYRILVRSHTDTWGAVSVRLQSRLGRDPQDATARLALGLLALDRGAPEAEALLREGAEGMRRVHDLNGEASAWRALVQVLVRQRRMEEAKKALAAASPASWSCFRPAAARAAKSCRARAR